MTGFDVGAGVPAAWYPDPQGPPLLRWWDGSGWTPQTMHRPAEPAIESAPAPVIDVAPVTAPARADPASAYVPMSEFASAPARPAYAAEQTTRSAHTIYAWTLAAYPLVQLVFGLIVGFVIEAAGGTAPELGFGGASIVLSLIWGYYDNKTLKERGFRPPGWGWTLIPLVYFILRLVRIGKPSLAPLLVWVGTQVVAVAVIVVAVGIPLFLAFAGSGSLSPTERAAILTPAGMAEAVSADLVANDYDVTSVVCPPLESTIVASAVTCQVETPTSTLYVVVETTPADPEYAYTLGNGWQVDK